MNHTYILLAAIGITSYLAFSNGELMFKSFFIPVNIKERNEYWRFLSHGFVHADMNHLLFNCITLFFFGPSLEYYFFELYGNQYVFVAFFLLALIMSSIPSYYKHQNNPRYRALGASGGISAILFGVIAFDPWIQINFFIPGIIFGIGYIWYSAKMSAKNQDNIGHDAHLWGGVFGFIFPFVTKFEHFPVFLERIMDVQLPFMN